MTEPNALNAQFLDRQRSRLTKMRRQLLTAQDSQAREESETNEELSGLARTNEDDGQRLAALELDGQLTDATRQRLQSIDRAIQKLNDGTYGQSDMSRSPIPIARLEAIPEAVLTLEEQQSRDKSHSRENL